MARTAVPITALSVNAGTAQSTVNLDATNGHVVAAAAKSRNLVLVVKNTYAGSKALTVKAGVKPVAGRSDLGDLTITLAQNAVQYVVLESARFRQKDGTINIDVAASMTGTIEAYSMPVDAS